MSHCLYVDNELEETDLSLSEALALEKEILEDDPKAIVRVEPEEDEEDLEEEDEEDYCDDDEEEDEDDE